MDAIRKALDEIKFRIPMEILQAVFIKRTASRRIAPTNIDNEILATCIRPRVLVDCNLIGGMEVWVPLSGVVPVSANIYTQVYHIPKTLTMGRSIISVINITFNDPSNLSNYGNLSTNQTSIALSIAGAVGDAQGAIPLTSSAAVQLIGENTVMIRDVNAIPSQVFLRCNLALDDNMSHLQLSVYPKFAKAVEYAVKAYIWTSYMIMMGTGELIGGQTIGVFKDIIDGYADAQQNYDDYLRDVLQKALYGNDQEKMKRLISMMSGGYR